MTDWRVAEAGATIDRRLQTPSLQADLAEMSRLWFSQTARVTVANAGAAAADPVALGRLRGALGEALAAVASAEAMRGAPCRWRPPCALDVLFRGHGKLKPGQELPPPYVLGLDPVGRDLELRLTLFGFACDWIEAAADALVRAVRTGRPFRAQGGPLDIVTRRSIETVEGLVEGRAARAFTITFVSPIHIRGADDLRERPEMLFRSLGFRLEGIARWHDASLQEDWRSLIEAAKACIYDMSGLRSVCWVRQSSRQGGRKIPMEGLVGAITIDDVADQRLALLLRLGALHHVGSHAGLGLGRYRVTDGLPGLEPG